MLLRLLALLLGPVLVAGCAGEARAPAPAPALAAPPAQAEIRLWAPTRAIAEACRAAQAQARFTFLCPTRLPRPTEGNPPQGLRVFPPERPQLDIGYSAGYEQPGTLHLNGPRRFLHLEIGRARGLARNARPARLGGRRGHYAPALSARFTGADPYYSNHASFVWRERGTRYAATLHTFGEPGTRRLLGRIVAGLAPADEIAPARPGEGLDAEVVELRAGASAIALDEDAVWVSTTGSPFGPDYRGRLLRLDAGDLSVRSERRVRSFSPSIAVGLGALWSAQPLVRRDLGTGAERARIRTAHSHNPVGIVPSERTLWLATNAYGTTRPRADVWRIDPARDRVLGRTRLPGQLGGIALAGPDVWVSDEEADEAVRIEAASGRIIGRVPIGTAPGPVAAGYGSVWVSNTAGRTVTRVDAESGAVRATIPVGDAPHGIAADGRGVWVATTGSGEVVRIDPRTDRLVQRIPLGGEPVALASDGRRLYVSINSEGLILRFDPEAGAGG